MSTPSPVNKLGTFAVTLEAAGATLRNAYLLKLAERSVRGVHRVLMLGMLLEIGAVSLCTGNPANASEVGLVCHPAWGTFGAASHCGLFIFARRHIRAQYSLGLLATTFNTDPEVIEADRAAFFKGGVYTIRAPEGKTEESFEKSIVDWANRYRAPYYDLLMGPNSNSAVAFPLIMSGAELPNVQQGVLGAWGLGYWSFLRDAAAGPAIAAAPNAEAALKSKYTLMHAMPFLGGRQKSQAYALSRQRHSRHKA